MCVPAPHPDSPRGVSRHVWRRNHLICRLWSACSRNVSKSAPMGRDVIDRIGDSSLTKHSVAPARPPLVFLYMRARQFECEPQKNLNLLAYMARPPLPLFLVCTKSLISVAECFVSTRKPSTEFHLGFDVESRGGN